LTKFNFSNCTSSQNAGLCCRPFSFSPRSISPTAQLLTHAENLLRHPEEWQRKGTFTEAIKRNPQAAPSVTFFQEEFIPARLAERRRLLNPYFGKIFTFSLDVNLRCQFGGLKPGIDWEEVEEDDLTVLLDFRDEVDPDMRRFKLLWVFSSLYEFIKRRGRRETPLALTIDEFSAMAYQVTDGTNPLAVMFDEFIQQYLAARTSGSRYSINPLHRLMSSCAIRYSVLAPICLAERKPCLKPGS
jgi:hypothetical protein